ncbi:MAG: TIGR04076 family protein [Thermoprotei archaeon]|nr:MAG: TIGR04076 family protein [Thermoprotei archaeon]
MPDVVIEVVEVRGKCALGYKPGDRILVKGFYVDTASSANVCIHALTGIMSLLSPFAHGVSARSLGIGEKDDEGYLQCPDPGRPYTCGGTVVFRVKRLV